MTHTSATSFATETSSAERKARKGTTPSSWQHNWFVLTSLVSKDFKLKYRRSLLGVLWSVLNPLLMMVVLAAVFSYMFRFSIDHYPLYLILGTVWFDFMSRATSSAMSSIIESQSLIKKIRIEKMLFPIEKVFFGDTGCDASGNGWRRCQYCYLAGCCYCCYGILSRLSNTMGASVLAIYLAVHVYFFSWHRAYFVGAVGIFPRRYASVGRRYYRMDVLNADLLSC